MKTCSNKVINSESHAIKSIIRQSISFHLIRNQTCKLRPIYQCNRPQVLKELSYSSIFISYLSLSNEIYTNVPQSSCLYSIIIFTLLSYFRHTLLYIPSSKAQPVMHYRLSIIPLDYDFHKGILPCNYDIKYLHLYYQCQS